MSKDIRRVKAFSSLILVFHLCLAITAAGQTCPECYKDSNPPAGRDREDGRKQLNIYQEGPFQQPGQYEATNHATATARSEWNNTTDEQGNRIPYFFEHTNEKTSADFIIRVGSAVGGCAHIDLGSQPFIITVSAEAIASPDFHAIMKHEIGHAIGLAEATKDPQCGQSTSIMRGKQPGTCIQHVKNIQPSDVAQVRRHSNAGSRAGCTENLPASQEVVDDCEDADGDGVSACDGDCNDYDPYLTFECGGSGDGSEGYTATEYYYEPDYYEPKCYARYMVTTTYDCSGSRCRITSQSWEYLGSYCDYQ